jgi:ABC-type antimicrobial peptide transport system permease subunit
MALGAEKRQVVGMVLRDVAVLIGAGLAFGSAMALATTRVLTTFLYGVRPDDPLTMCAAAVVLAAAAASAGYSPARRASRVDPMTALREE